MTHLTHALPLAEQPRGHVELRRTLLVRVTLFAAVLTVLAVAWIIADARQREVPVIMLGVGSLVMGPKKSQFEAGAGALCPTPSLSPALRPAADPPR